MERNSTPLLSVEQSQALAAAPDVPLRVVDPQTQHAYVLLPAEIFDRVKALLADDYSLRDTYSAQIQAALRAGWGDPGMDAYDNYDENYRKLCQSDEATSS